MSKAAYIQKLKQIRDELRTGHEDLVMGYPRANAREELPRLFSLYNSIEELDRIIAAEEARSRGNNADR